MSSKPYFIVFYDGDCGMCNRIVVFLFKRDVKKIFRYASLDSEKSKDYLRTEFGINKFEDTILLEKKGKLYSKSDAALIITRELSGFWKYLYYYIYIPRFIRDFIYDIIASKRKTIFSNNFKCSLENREIEKYEILK